MYLTWVNETMLYMLGMKKNENCPGYSETEKVHLNRH